MRSAIVLASFGLLSASVLAESAAGVRWTAPDGWVNEGSRLMRAATYRIAPAAGDKTSAECGVYFFGAGQGGTIEANLERWKNQFKDPSGKVAPAQIAKRTIHGLTITTIDTAGEYSGMGGPMAASSSTVQGYRLLGAIVTGSGGNVFVKLTGPAKTIAANQQKFEQMLASFQPDK
jgi:hypothetical protein